MAIVKLFRGVRPKPEFVDEVASVPYDVVNTDEARELAASKPKSFLRVVRSELEFDASTDPYSDEIYERAKKNFDSLIEKGVLLQDDEPSLYIYRIIRGSHTQTGVVGCSSVDDYENNLVKKHEKTRPDKENDRTRHILTIGAQAGPVLLTYKADERIKALIDGQTQASPLNDFTAEDGVRHIFWKASNGEELSTAFEAVPHTYIADGHHRVASAARARAKLQTQNPGHT
ncbi:MAG: DUF1015 family protein, partial [Gammaproteobacteria bacterium]